MSETTAVEKRMVELVGEALATGDRDQGAAMILGEVNRIKDRVDRAANSLHALIGGYPDLRLSLGDDVSCVVNFSGKVTKRHMESFAKIFSQMAQEYTGNSSTIAVEQNSCDAEGATK